MATLFKIAKTLPHTYYRTSAYLFKIGAISSKTKRRNNKFREN
jgi:hypothetical protein